MATTSNHLTGLANSAFILFADRAIMNEIANIHRVAYSISLTRVCAAFFHEWMEIPMPSA